MTRNYCFLLMCCLTVALAQAQIPDVQRVEPPFWWSGMKNSELQLLVYGKNIAASTVTVGGTGVSIKKIEKTENANYQFVYLDIQSAKAGTYPITFQSGKKKKTINYELKERKKPAEQFKGFNTSDVIYLIMPDRFANGDETNDNIAGMNESLNRTDPFGRHGGDIQGIINQLDYLQDLGVTSLWINPVQENNQPKQSYHGYAITDFYNIDRRFGNNSLYLSLVDKVHARGMKMVMDMVFNHCGNEHWFIKDLPAKDWIHQFAEYTSSNYRLSTTLDPYVSKFDQDKMQQGWFDKHMPDLNQHHPLLAKYLIQNSIWWVEYAQLDGIRMDTHPYPYKDFMAAWCKEVMNEYPNFNIVGEVWESRVMLTSYFQTDVANRDGYKGHLPSVTDFPLCFTLNTVFNERDGWEEGLAKIYYTLIQDAAYANAANNVTFLDNHDLTRFATSVSGNIAKQKMGFATLLTMRGIPQLFYGGEIGMLGDGSNHGTLRADMPGGWKSDTRNTFTKEGRTVEENELFNYLRALLQWRKNKPVIHQGKFMHFVPENGVYVYFRYDANESVMVILNNSDESKTLDTRRFAERMTGYTYGLEAITGERIMNLNTLNVKAKSATIIDLKK